MDHSVIVYPESTEDVVRIVKIATKYRDINISGTHQEGSVLIWAIWIKFSLFRARTCQFSTKLQRANFVTRCQLRLGMPTRNWVSTKLSRKRVFCCSFLYVSSLFLIFSLKSSKIDPAHVATIGGMMSTRCSGSMWIIPNAFPVFSNLFSQPMPFVTEPQKEIGSWTWFVVSLASVPRFFFSNVIFQTQTVVLPSGEVIKTRRRSQKTSAGFDTTKLFIGAEGTLGITYNRR